MTAAICPLMHNSIADSIYNAIVSKSSKYYYFLGKTVPYTLVAGIEQVETPLTSYKYESATRRDIISMKQITGNDVSYVVPRIDWVLGTVYDHYDDSYTVSNPSHSGATDIANAKFYVLTSDFNVYVCLDNNYDSISTVTPTGYDTLPVVTNDGYKWKFMMNLPLALRTKFLTNSQMPVTNAVNNIFYNNGAIDTVIIEDSGSGYPSNTTAAITVTSPTISSGSFVIGQTYVISNLGTASSIQSKWNTVAGTTGITYTTNSIFTSTTNGSTLTGATVKGTGAIVVPYISTIDGSISTAKITNGGTGYPAGTTLTVSGNGTGKLSGNATALLTPVMLNGIITHVIINDPGKNYNNNATNIIIQSDTGQDAKLSAIVSAGQITDLIIDDPGFGYKNANITAVGTGGVGAKLMAVTTGGKLDTIQSNIELLAVDGTIDYIKVTNGGSGYYSVLVSITGDGEGATATATVTNGIVRSIVITNRGFGYTYATVTLTPNGGTNLIAPTARAIISPKSGHGKNIISELFAKSLMFYSTIAHDNSTGFAVDNDYRQFGIVKNPTQHNSTHLFFGQVGIACYSAEAAISNGTISNDMILSNSSGNRFVVVSNTPTKLLLQPIDNAVLLSGTALTFGSTTAYITSINYGPTVDKYSGDMMYIDNRAAFHQTNDQTVMIQTTLTF